MSRRGPPGLISDDVDERFTRSVAPLIRRLVLWRVSPDAITVAAFVITLGCAGLIVAGHLVWACALLVLGGVLDFTDGKVAALTGRASIKGAILDSTLDRYSDAAVCLGLLVFFARNGHEATALAAAFALVGSAITSYLMALADSHGRVLRAGLLRRQDRVALLAAGLIFSPLHGLLAGWIGVGPETVPNLPLATVVWLLAVLTNVSAVQRLFALLRVADGAPADGTSDDSLRVRQLRTLQDLMDEDGSRGRSPHED
jgi:CDP-diacylglycerol--glycerol-3-phosphate 3-phosphatidyltransferase